jgi:hypothetical protein
MSTRIRKLVGLGAVLAATAPVFAHIQQHLKLTASDGFPGDLFGHAIAVHEDLLAVGAPAQDINGADSGAVYVFERTGLDWEEHVKLLAFDGNPFDRFGEAVAISHHTIAVGSPQDDDLGNKSGAVYVYVETGGVWALEAKLLPSDGTAGDEFGSSVDIEGDVILVGAPLHDLVGVGVDAGAIYLFGRSGTTWTETVKLLPADPGARKHFGASVALTGEAHSHTEHADNRLIAGAPQDSDVVAYGGSAYVFRELSGVWSEEAKLTDASPGENDLFGTAVDLLDGLAVVGSPREDDFMVDAGSIFVFDETSHAWPQTQHIVGAFATNPNRLLGTSVAISHGVAVAGAPMEDVQGSSGAGQAYIWFTEEVTWEPEVGVADDPVDGAHLGISVATSGCWLFAGADRDDEMGPDSGAVFVYPSNHHMDAYCTAGTSASGCQALLEGSGIPSASASTGFMVDAQGVEGVKDGLFYFGANGQQAVTWLGSSSFQCVVPPVIRTPVLPGSGTAGQCDGVSRIDLNALWCPTCPFPAKNPGGGAVIDIQFWYRDPGNTSGAATSLSNALEVEICP